VSVRASRRTVLSAVSGPLGQPTAFWRRLLGLALVVASAACTVAYARDVVVIAHRGASGYLPEHTLEAFAMAHAQGADYLEVDLVMAGDGTLVVLHDLTLEATTNVDEVFPDRHRSNGRWYAVDFTVEELQQLRVHERTDRDGAMVWPGRFPLGLGSFRVPTFAEFVDLVRGLNHSTGRDVGLYVELKHPVEHAALGLPMEAAVLHELARYPGARVVLQSFSLEALRTLRFELGTDLPLVFLLSSTQQATVAALDRLAGWVDGIGPSKALVEANPGLVRWAQERGMVVHAWTFRADAVPPRYPSFEQEIAAFVLTHGVDGLFTDHPDVVVGVLAGLGLRGPATR
jgi:glycerophosphoryl diester phosphodiesterase